MKNIYKLSFCFFFFSCTQQWTERGEISLQKFSESCEESLGNEHWLVDLIVVNPTMSDTMINTYQKTSKLELAKSHLLIESDFYSILAELCNGDSVNMKLSASTLYKSLGGEVPSSCKPESNLTVALKLHEALDSFSYVAHKLAFEDQAIKAFLSKTKWHYKRDTTNGIAYEYLKTVAGDTKTNSGVVKLKKITSLTGEQIWDPGDAALRFSPKRRLTPGIHYLAEQLMVGEEVRAVIPSQMAYGARGIEGKVAPYLPIYIELERIE